MEVEEKKKLNEVEKIKLKENKMKYSFLRTKKERLLDLIEREKDEIEILKDEGSRMGNLAYSYANTISTRDIEKTISLEKVRVCDLTSIN